MRLEIVNLKKNLKNINKFFKILIISEHIFKIISNSKKVSIYQRILILASDKK